MPLCRQHCADAGVAGGGFGAEIGPRVEIGNRVDDAGADFAIGGTGAVNPVFSSVRGERLRNRAASAVRKYRGGRPAFGSDI